MNQRQVLEIYLTVIDATIEGVRAECAEKGADEATMDSLARLKERWATRLTHTHDFTEDSAIIDKPSSSSSAKGGKKSGKNAKKKGASPKSGKPSSSRNGVISVAALTNQTDDVKAEDSAAPVPGSSVHIGKPEPLPTTKPRDAEGEPPAKRRRPDPDDGQIEHGGEDLDSSDDSDVQGAEADEDAENFILAQHDRVKKGPKWKVVLREGIVSIRGREYLFNKASCDLDF